MNNNITADQISTRLDEKKIMARAIRKNEDEMKLYLIELKNEIAAFMTAKMKFQFFCLQMNLGIFQKTTIIG
jgi:hypothetical protein